MEKKTQKAALFSFRPGGAWQGKRQDRWHAYRQFTDRSQNAAAAAGRICLYGTAQHRVSFGRYKHWLPPFGRPGPPHFHRDLDFDADLYGQTISVDLYDFLRPTVKFSSLQEVQRQVSHDCEQVRLLLGPKA